MRRRPLAAQLALILACSATAGHVFGSNLVVTSCQDDLSAGTLRVAVANAAASQTIDLYSQLACSTITLSQGEIATNHNVTLLGSADHRVTIAGGGNGRVFDITGSGSNAGSISLTHLNITGGNNVLSGGCILASAAVVLDDTTVSNCVTAIPKNNAGYGAAISAPSVSLMNASQVSDSHAITGPNPLKYHAYGGGVFASTSFSCSDSSISGNYAQFGGGVATRGSVSIDRCTINSNRAVYGGGFADFATSSPFTITQSTVSGNAAFKGAGIYTKSALTMYNSTVAFNISSSNYAAGIYAKDGVVMQSSIAADNFRQDGEPFDISILQSAHLSGADNAIMFTNATPYPGVITVTTDPRLAPLADHGGPTRTHALLADSPAIDHGNNSQSFGNDQRGSGFIRSVGVTDIGAYERQIDDDEIFADGFD